MAENPGWDRWRDDVKVEVALPDWLGVSQDVFVAYPDAMADFARWQLADGFFDEQYYAVLLAPLPEACRC